MRIYAAERAALALSGLMLLASALITGRLAFTHMQFMGEACGFAAAPHCGWCAATAALAALAVLSFTLARAPARIAARVRV